MHFYASHISILHILCFRTNSNSVVFFFHSRGNAFIFDILNNHFMTNWKSFLFLLFKFLSKSVFGNSLQLPERTDLKF